MWSKRWCELNLVQSYSDIEAWDALRRYTLEEGLENANPPRDYYIPGLSLSSSDLVAQLTLNNFGTAEGTESTQDLCSYAALAIFECGASVHPMMCHMCVGWT